MITDTTMTITTTTSQRDQILADLKRGAKITGMDALKNYGCWALPQRIHELKRAGYPIERRMVNVGQGKHVAEYSYAHQ